MPDRRQDSPDGLWGILTIEEINRWHADYAAQAEALTAIVIKCAQAERGN
jgi:hypothetical protein